MAHTYALVCKIANEGLNNGSGMDAVIPTKVQLPSPGLHHSIIKSYKGNTGSGVVASSQKGTWFLFKIASTSIKCAGKSLIYDIDVPDFKQWINGFMVVLANE